MQPDLGQGATRLGPQGVDMYITANPGAYAPQGTPEGPTLSHPARHVQAALCRAAPCCGLLWRGCRSAGRGAANPVSTARPRAGDAGVGQGARSPGAGAKMPFEIPIREAHRPCVM